MSTKEQPAGQTWLRLSEAADYLGVHPSTLRRWSDEGKVPCIRTPGGRRRFSVEKLSAFLGALSETSEQNAPQAAMEVLLHAPVSNGHGRMILHEEPWYGQIDQAHREIFRQQGRKLMSALMHYAARDDAAETYLQEGCRLASEYAELLLSTGLSLGDTLHAFLLVRKSITQALHETGTLDGPPDTATWRLYKRTHDFLDYALMAIVDIYRHST